MIRGLIFDVDGTLVSLKVDRERLNSTTAAVFVDMGVDVSFMKESNLHTQEMIDRVKQEVETGAVKADFNVVRTNLNKALDGLEMEWNALAEPIAGASDVLAELKSRSVKLATLTNSGRAPSEWLLSKHGLLRYFDFTLSRDEVKAMKPSSDGMLKAIAMMGFPREQILYVGDSIIDVKAAKGAGLKIASVTTGRYPFERLRQEGSDYILGSLSEILGLL